MHKLLALAMGTCVAAAALAQSLPQRNLLVEWRWVDASDTRQDAAALQRGDVVVGTGGRVDARGQLVLRSGRGQARSESVQRVSVLNGGRAGVRFTQDQPFQWVEVARTPYGAVGVQRTAWVEAGSVVEVQPRWAGGSAPVTVELVQQTTRSGDDGPDTRELVGTRLQLPLGAWVAVAQSGAAAGAHESGVLSSSSAERTARRELQLRVSAP